MATTKNYSGPIWKSKNLDQSFILLSDFKTTELGSKDLADYSYPFTRELKSIKYTGVPAVRIDDELRALVNLTEKPSNYPYDFVLL